MEVLPPGEKIGGRFGNPKQLENDEFYPEPGTACRHFNMIEMLKVEENKKKGAIGVSSKTKPVAEAATTSKATTKPTASELLAVKLRKKENLER